MYLPALADHPIGHRLRARYCRSQGVANSGASLTAYTDWAGDADSGEIDAVIVASTNSSHFEITMAALDRGLPVLCEKPLGMTADEAEQMADSAGRNDAITMVPFTYRFMPTNQFVKRLIVDGYVGQPYQ